jgi:hypothetical protein
MALAHHPHSLKISARPNDADFSTEMVMVAVN